MIPLSRLSLVGVACLLLVAVTADATESTGSTAGADRDLDFASRILPILTRHGCNSGGCHGAGGGTGQNGFYLSLFGFEPVSSLDGL